LYGPLPVRYGENEFAMAVPAPPEAGYITSMRATVVDHNGDPMSHHMVHLHHAVWLDPTRQDMTCPGYPDRFFASGKERTKLEFPPGYGYFWSNESFWVLIAHLDGMHRGMEHDAFVRLNMGFSTGPQGTLTDVDPVWLDVRNCSDDPVFDVAKGSGSRGRYRERWDYTMPEGGSFLTMGGHLHDGGMKLVLKNVTQGSEVFTSRATYGRESDPWYLTSMSAFSADPGIEVSAGDLLRLVAVYDSTHSWHDVMGIMVGYLAAPATE
jgi:hypothetical protein